MSLLDLDWLVSATNRLWVRVIVLTGLLSLSMGCSDSSMTEQSVDVGNEISTNEGVRPNILLIMADDLGYSDLGFMGGEIRTPNLDQLASESLVLTNFYAMPVCTPTRLQLMTGIDNNLVKQGRFGGLKLVDTTPTIAEVLRDSGYETMMVGKWDIGWGQGLTPHDRGFEQSFALLPGAGDHFNRLHEGTARAGMEALNENGEDVRPEDFFSTISYTDKLLEYISNRQDADKPFFAYAAFTAPHWPIQASEALIDSYLETYSQGYQEIGKARMAKLQGSAYGEIATQVNTPDIPQWDELTERRQDYEAKRMAVYAAMTDTMDQQIGRILDSLQESGELDNTVVIFLSDNGADAVSNEEISITVADAEAIDNSYANLGLYNSYAAMGNPWGRVSSMPYRGVKNQTLEGGIKVPALIQLPGVDRLEAASSHALADVRDLVSTIYDLAEVEEPYLAGISPALDGRSLLPLFAGETSVRDEMVLYNHHRYTNNRMAALFKNEWKLVGDNDGEGDLKWALYNLSEDPSESIDLLQARPEVSASMWQMWLGYTARIGIEPGAPF